jgi:RNA recognition motif-containing protein
MNIFIGNLSFNVTEGDLRQAFEAFGQVASATVIKDKQSGRSKGFGFVEMPVQTESQSAIEVLNGKALKGRTITVNEARSQADDRRGRDRGGGEIDAAVGGTNKSIRYVSILSSCFRMKSCKTNLVICFRKFFGYPFVTPKQMRVNPIAWICPFIGQKPYFWGLR